MHITCIRCNTTYLLDSDLVKDTGTKVRCSKCKHVFIAYNKEHQRVKSNALGDSANDTDTVKNEFHTDQIADDDLGYLKEKESRIQNRRVEFNTSFDTDIGQQSPTIVESYKANHSSCKTAEKLKQNESSNTSFGERNNVDINIKKKGTIDSSEDLNIEENIKNNIDDSGGERTDRYFDVPCVPTLDEDFDLSFFSQGQEGQDGGESQEWGGFDFEPDEFDEEIQAPRPDEVDIDIDVSAEDRARQMAMQVAEDYGWGNKQIELLAGVFRNYGWSFTRTSILNELKLGMKYYEFQFAVELRKIWQSHPEYSIGYVTSGSFGDNSLKYRSVYKNPDWAFCLKIVRGFDSIPDPEELEQHLDSLFSLWKNSPSIQGRYNTYYDFIRNAVDAGDGFSEMQVWQFLH